MNNKIPLFPLDTVLLPNEEIELHIFEDRYKKMINNCLKSNKQFGVVFKKNDHIHKIGCSAKILDVIKDYDSGEYDILIQGNNKFNILKMLKNNNLWIGNIQYTQDSSECLDKTILNDTKNKYINILLNHRIVKDIDIELKKDSSFQFIQKILLPNNIKQIFLELNSEKDRIILLNNLFGKVIKAKSKQHKDDLN